MIIKVKLIDLVNRESSFDPGQKNDYVYIVNHISESLAKIRRDYGTPLPKTEVVTIAKVAARSLQRRMAVKAIKKNWTYFLNKESDWLQKSVHEFDVAQGLLPGAGDPQDVVQASQVFASDSDPYDHNHHHLQIMVPPVVPHDVVFEDMVLGDVTPKRINPTDESPLDEVFRDYFIPR